MSQFKILGVALASALLVAACGGGDGGDPFGTQVANPARGQLMQSPPARVTSLTAAAFTASLNASASGQGLLQLAGAPVCGVDVQYIKYGTVGGAAVPEATTASGALMTPTAPPGSTAEVLAKCTGARPIVLYAHGTNITKRYNLAEIADSSNPANSESVLLAAMYAAQGFIVVAPNYAGYDSSSLSYHPYVNADQQSKDMIDALAAAKAALPTLISPTTANSKLFVTGYSQGGFVAMATQRALQLAGTPVTASAPMSGPYALAAYLDAIFYGNVALGSTAFAPLATNSFQKAYGNIYTTPSDIYETAYATGIDSLVPGAYDFTTVYSSGKLPQTYLFNSTPPTAPNGSPAIVQLTLNATTPPTGTGATDALFALGFGTSNLIKNSARLDYLMDAMTNPDGAVPSTTTAMPATTPVNKIRVAAKANDLRGGWAGPTTPTLLCGGNADPTVFYSVNTQLMAAIWSAQVTAHLVNVLDVDSAPGTPGVTNPFYAAKAGFAQQKAALIASAGANAATAVTTAYHGSLVPPFCNAAARGFFSNFL
jgi:pimeloyl-ACP methyl ester carboxylesterase